MTETKTIPLSEKFKALAIYGLTAVALRSILLVTPETSATIVCAEGILTTALVLTSWAIAIKNFVHYGRIV